MQEITTPELLSPARAPRSTALFQARGLTKIYRMGDGVGERRAGDRDRGASTLPGGGVALGGVGRSAASLFRTTFRWRTTACGNRARCREAAGCTAVRRADWRTRRRHGETG